MSRTLTPGLSLLFVSICVIAVIADAQTDDSSPVVVDHQKVKKYFLELYNQALQKAMKEQDNKEGIPTMHSDTNEFRGFHEDHSSSFSNFDDKNHNRFGIESNRHEGFDGFESNTFSNPVQHTSLRRGGHHHKHHHHQHSHKHTNDHKHAHKHLHEQSHEHKHSAKHQHVHKHEHHHEHNHHHKHKEAHEHKQDHKHSHKHLHSHKGNSWRRQGDENEALDRRQDTQTAFEPINAEMSFDDEILVPIGASGADYSKKPGSAHEYQEIEYDAWEQI